MNLRDLIYAGRNELQAYSKSMAKVPEGHSPSVATCLGGAFYIDTIQDDPDVSPWLLSDGCWEAWVTVATGKLVDQRGIKHAVNIGANIGYYTLFLAALGVSVDAFEPQPLPWEHIHRSLFTTSTILHPKTQGFVRVFQEAITKDGGLVQLAVPPPIEKGRQYGSATTACVPEDWEPITVQSRPLTDLPLTTDLIFCDAEGAEESIFSGDGARDWLTTARPAVMCEWSPTRYTDPAAALRFWTDMGWSVRRVDYEGNIVRASERELLSAKDWITILCEAP